ncbi:small ribosomal subunit protein mS29 [Panulirus ornatus]|uniref:small ribosomal subunit protein mS29 n=1 Tax=Panulirus ornatus TaxID=150431 RepID=UPI003A8C6EE1
MAKLLNRIVLPFLPNFGPSRLFQVQKIPGLLKEPRCWSSEAGTSVKIKAPRTSVNQPGLHTQDHLGLWYTLDPDLVNRLFGMGGMTKQYVIHCETFAETCLMIRQPALTLIDGIKRSSLALPPNKFILYGQNGVGKTCSLVHVTHFLSEDGWLLLHVPWAPRWRRDFKEVSPSASVPGRYDHPLDAVLWLQHFRSQNTELLKTLKLETTERYFWSRREVTEVGVPLTALVDLGISRARFASDCIMGLTSELKKHATEGRCKIAVVVDGINTFFCPTSRFRREDRSFVETENFTIFQAFKHLFKSDWKNGVIVGSVDGGANESQRRESYLPRYLLRLKGWEALDPFVPILVSNYNELEMLSVVDYYVDRNWLQTPGGASNVGRRELAALSGYNPFTLMAVCKSL